MICWILTDGRKGTENNAKGLAESVGLPYELKPVALRQPWKTLSPWLRAGLSRAVTPKLIGPWPDLIISAGRTPAVAALAVKRQSPKTLLVHITNAGIRPHHFDLVITPQHDHVTSDNVLTTIGALHGINPIGLDIARAQWAPQWAHLPRPWHGLIIGGSAHGYKLTTDLLHTWLSELEKLGGTIIATTSRRTDKAVVDTLNLLKQRGEPPQICWMGEGPNPYPGLLALCDNLFVTNESVSMASEAAATGKPVYLLKLNGQHRKFDDFNAALIKDDHARAFASPLPLFTPRPLDDMQRASEAVRQLLRNHGMLPNG